MNESESPEKADNSQAAIIHRNRSLQEESGFRTIDNDDLRNDKPMLIMEKSLDLASNSSQEIDFDTYIKNRDQRYRHSIAKSQHISQTNSLTAPQRGVGQIAPLDFQIDQTEASNFDNLDKFSHHIEPLQLDKITKRDGLKSQRSMKSSKTNRSGQPEVKKASGVEVSIVSDEDLPPPRDDYKYISRNTIKYDDQKSVCSAEKDDGEDELMNKTSQAYLEKVKAKIEKEMLRTELMIEAEKQKKALGAKSDQDVKPNKRFKHFNDVFSGLTRSRQVQTQDPMVSCIITQNSRSALAITKQSDRLHTIFQFSLETAEMTFMETVGGRQDEYGDDISYIKCNEIEQNSDGDLFACCYLDDGYFFCRIFGQMNRSHAKMLEYELDINKALGLDNHTMPIDNFPDPFIDCTFIHNELLFINLFHNKKIEHHHFFYYWREKRIESHTILKIESSPKNFPTKCFYNQEYNEVYTFYRQGQSYRIPVFELDVPANIENEKPKKPYYYQKIFDKDLGQMFLINDTALVARSSAQILFFRLFLDEFTGQKNWINYHTIEEGGNIYFIKGNKRIQIVTETKIYFYLIDLQTYEVTLENQMNNFMNCSIMMFGPKVKYGITYKTNEQSFDIYRRKYVHDFKVNTVAMDLDGSRGLPIESMEAFLVSRIDKIMFFDIHSFQEIDDCRIRVPLLESTTRERNEIISMQVSQCQNFLAVITGKNLIKAEQKPNQIFVFKRVKNLNVDSGLADKFELMKKIRVADEEEFTKISMQFIFKIMKYNREPDTLIFARQDKIILLNFMTEQIYDLAVFDMPLLSQPEFFLMTDDQDIAIIATPQDGIYFNMTNGMWVDLDECYDIGSIKEIIHDADTRQIYIIANRHQGKMGVFLIKFHEQNPKKFNFFLKYKTNLDISDADIAVMRNKNTGFKELIISFKTVVENTYNVYIVDISQDEPWPLFRHESFQLWETQITAFFIHKTNDYVTINQDGISLISLESFDKKYVKSADGQEKMIHAIESVNYLKVDLNNFIHFDFASPIKKLRIVQQFQKEGKSGPETAYEEIFSLRVHDMTLRELLLFQSLYVCATQTDILNLVKSQFNPQIFYKTFLELDGTNMVSILSFDSRCMQTLLKEDNAEYFTDKHPLFYKNKIQKSDNKERFFYRSAIDMALISNQLTAVASIIQYIINHQNNFVSSFLFQKNIITLMQRGVQLSELFNSQVFNYTFDYDEWPSTHTVRQSFSRAYNGNLFQIRDKYREIFPEPQFEVPNEDTETGTAKIFKISYKMNLLIQSGEFIEWGNVNPAKDKTFTNKHLSFMDECFRSEELELFNSEAIKDILYFKWKTFATKFHMIGCIMHFAYMFLLFNYIYQIYINFNEHNMNLMNVVLCAGLLYPCLYEMYQVKRMGKNYFYDINNFNDQLYVWCGLVNLISVQFSSTQAFHNKVIVTVILFQQILKTFFYLRIFATLSYIVTMIFQVVKDLRAFLIFFFILVVLFGLVFAVLGAGNQNQPGAFKDFYDECAELEDTEDACDEIPNEEYASVGLLFGNLFYTLRTGIGDFDFGASYYLSHSENLTFFIIWFLVVVILCIIFLNFIIAEASASYAKVVENLDALKNKEKAALISEAESMIPDRFKNPTMLPKFIIIREEDN